MVARAFLFLVIALFAAARADDAPPFNKEELEALLKKEHSQKISNIYDSQNGIQCAPPLHSRARLCTAAVAHTR